MLFHNNKIEYNFVNSIILYNAHSELELRDRHDPIPIRVKMIVNPPKTESFIEQIWCKWLKKKAKENRLHYELEECKKEYLYLYHETQMQKKEFEDVKILNDSLLFRNQQLECDIIKIKSESNAWMRYNKILLLAMFSSIKNINYILKRNKWINSTSFLLLLF